MTTPLLQAERRGYTGVMTEPRRAGTLSTGLDILEALSTAPDGLGVTELAQRLGADKGNVHRLLQVLLARGYVEQSPPTRRYHVSGQLIALTGHILRSLDVVAVARPAMQALCQATGESVHLARRTRTGAVYIAQERHPSRLSVETEIGMQIPLHATATGKALYATERGDLRRLLSEPYEAFTSRTLTAERALWQDLERVVARGYSVDDRELNLDVRCVASPVFDLYGHAVACIGVSGPASRVTAQRVPELGAEIRAAAGRVTASIGGAPPSGFGRAV